MSVSEWIHILHWAIYITSFIAVALLFTHYRKWGAVWIAVLFLSQAVFHGCFVVDWQNYYRVKEGLSPITNGMLTDRFSSAIWVQAIMCYLVAISAGILSII